MKKKMNKLKREKQLMDNEKQMAQLEIEMQKKMLERDTHHKKNVNRFLDKQNIKPAAKLKVQKIPKQPEND